MSMLSSFSLPVIILLLPVVVASCVKPPDNFDPRDADIVYDGCRVQQTNNQEVPGIPVLTHQFFYNNNNDPVSVTTNAVNTGNPNLVFKYDKKHRLIEYSGIYTNGFYEFQHHYGYVQNRIVTDTIYALGLYGDPTSYNNKRISFISYDNFDRVSQDSSIFINPALPASEITKYSYDQNGNLEGAFMYDNKLNPHRTHKIWMFIDRNYSVNNPFAASRYNSVGLPLSFPALSKLTTYFRFANTSYYMGVTSISYDCK